MYQFILIFCVISIQYHCKKCNMIPGFPQNLSFLVHEKFVAETGLLTTHSGFSLLQFEKVFLALQRGTTFWAWE